MKNIEPAFVGKSLELERDYMINPPFSGVRKIVLQRQINIFYSVYILSMAAENELKEISNIPEGEEGLLKLYRMYYQTKFNGVRYLFELFLTSLYIYGEDNIEKAEYIAFSICASERINAYKLDLFVLDTDPSNPVFQKKVQDEEKQFSDFITLYLPAGMNVESNLGFIVDEINRSGGKDLEKILGFSYSNQNKVQKYGKILSDNHLLDGMIDVLHSSSLFNKGITVKLLKHLYSILSNQTHPTVTNVTEFEFFIKDNKEKKIETIKRNMEESDTWLKVIGTLMDALFKYSRGFDISKLKYSEK